MTIAAERYTGASIKRSEDPRILTGAGRYVDDIKLPGMLHAAFVRSPLAHARVLSVDASAARELPGVVAVLTGADLDAITVSAPDPLLALFSTGGPTPEFTLLATDKVRLVGDPVAIVVAESRYLAEDGCELVEVEYDDLPAGGERPPSRSTRPARRCSRIWGTTFPARTRATSSATSPARSPRLIASWTSTSTCTGTRTCPWRDAAASRAGMPT